MAGSPSAGGIRVAELVATVSYAADLGLGQPMSHCMRKTVIALRLADLIDVTDRDREATYYLGLLTNSYCHADATEQARWFGDDISFKGDAFDLLGMNTAQSISFLLRHVGSRGSGGQRMSRLASFPLTGFKEMVGFLATHTTLGGRCADRISLAPAAAQ